MATSISNPTLTNPKVWKYEWTGTAPFRIYRYDWDVWEKLDYQHTQIVLVGDSSLQPPAVEIFDATEVDDTPEGELYPARTMLQWRGVADAAKYIIRNSGGDNVGEVQETGSGYYTFVASPEADTTAVSLNVTVVDKAGNESDIDVSLMPQTLIANPRPVKLDFSYDSGTTTLTITEGSD